MTYTCETCGEEFEEVEAHNSHQSKHTDSKPDFEGSYKCDDCGETFDIQQRYATHRQKHVEQPIEPKYYNGKKVYRTEIYGRKARVIEKECKTCSEKFEVPITRLEEGYGQYCSRKCFKDDNSKTQDKQDHITQIKNNSSCKLCEEDRNPALDFHHLDEERKEQGISEMIDEKYTLEELKSEVEKCEIICANCHRVQHSNYET